MATYTLTTTAAQETAISFVVAQENARRAAQNPPLGPITNAQYLKAVTDNAFDSYAKQAADIDISEVATAYKSATPAKQAAAKAAALAALG